jgi:SAM-dependent methyltransferase
MAGQQRTDDETLRTQLLAWKQGIPSEALFWNEWMKQRGGEWAEDFERRFDPENPLDPWIAAAARGLGKEKVSILDVGSGPVPAIGYKLYGVTLQIAAVDPLASVYNDLLDSHGLKPPIVPKFAPAEELSSFFETSSFDIVHCRNALDHSFDPLRGVTEMLRVARVGGLVLLRHHRNEAENAEYDGFHQFNFDLRNGDFVIWNKSIRVNIAEFLAGHADVSVAMPGHVDVTIRKLTNPEEPPEASKYRLQQYLKAFVEIFNAPVQEALIRKPAGA